MLQTVLAHAVEDEGGSLLGGAALIGLALAADRGGRDVLDDGGWGEGGRGAGDQAEGDGDNGRELHDELRVNRGCCCRCKEVAGDLEMRAGSRAIAGISVCARRCCLK